MRVEVIGSVTIIAKATQKAFLCTHSSISMSSVLTQNLVTVSDSILHLSQYNNTKNVLAKTDGMVCWYVLLSLLPKLCEGGWSHLYCCFIVVFLTCFFFVYEFSVWLFLCTSCLLSEVNHAKSVLWCARIRCCILNFTVFSEITFAHSPAPWIKCEIN